MKKHLLGFSLFFVMLFLFSCDSDDTIIPNHTISAQIETNKDIDIEYLIIEYSGYYYTPEHYGYTRIFRLHVECKNNRFEVTLPVVEEKYLNNNFGDYISLSEPSVKTSPISNELRIYAYSQGILKGTVHYCKKSEIEGFYYGSDIIYANKTCKVEGIKKYEGDIEKEYEPSIFIENYTLQKGWNFLKLNFYQNEEGISVTERNLVYDPDYKWHLILLPHAK